MPTARPRLFQISRELPEVLAALEPCSVELQWYCVEMDLGSISAAAYEGVRARDIRELRDELRRSLTDVSLAWERLKSLANDVSRDDIVLFVATKSDFPFPSWPLNLSSLSFEITIQTGDNDCWYVMTRDEGVIARLSAEFKKSPILV